MTVGSVLNLGVLVRLHILDNASTDGTEEWTRDLAHGDQRVSVTRQTENVGSIPNYSGGFRSVATKYFIPLADDDELGPLFLSAALTVVKDGDEVGGGIGKTEFRDFNGKRTSRFPLESPSGVTNPSEHLREWMDKGHYSWSSILWSTEVVRRCDALERALPFGGAADVAFQFLVFLETPVYFVEEVGSVFNSHPGQASRNHELEELDGFGRLLSYCKGALIGAEYEDLANENCFGACARRWANCAKDGFERYASSNSYTTEELKGVYDAYGEHFLPVIDLEGFPLGLLIEGNVIPFHLRAGRFIRRILRKLSLKFS